MDEFRQMTKVCTAHKSLRICELRSLVSCPRDTTYFVAIKIARNVEPMR